MFQNRALLLDRDGVINEDVNFVGTIDRFRFLPGLFPFLRAVRNRGYRLAIITNQSGVGRGHFSEADHNTLTNHMVAGLAAEGVEIEETLASFEHPEMAGQNAYGRESFWRKPNPGMVLEVARRLNLDLSRSAFLGDARRDMESALAGGVGTCLWLTQKATDIPQGVTVVADYDAALKLL